MPGRALTPAEITTLLSEALRLYDEDFVDSSNVVLGQALDAIDAGPKLSDSDSAAVLGILGAYYRSRQRGAQAKPLLVEAYHLLQRNVPVPDSIRILILRYRASQYHYDAAPDAAIPLLEEALRIQRQQSGSNLVGSADILLQMADCHYALGNAELAAKLRDTVLQLAQSLTGRDKYVEAQALQDLAGSFYSASEYWKAESLLVRASALWEQSLGPKNLRTVDCLQFLSVACYCTGEINRSLGAARKAVASLESRRGSPGPNLSFAYVAVANAYFYIGALDSAALYAEKAAALDSILFDPCDAQTVQTLIVLAGIYRRECRFEDAEVLLRRALVALFVSFGLDVDDADPIYYDLGKVHLAAHDLPEAEKHFRTSYDLRLRHGTLNERQLGLCRLDLGYMAAIQGHPDLAMRQMHDAGAFLIHPPEPKHFTMESAWGSAATIYRLTESYDSSLQCYMNLMNLQRSFVEEAFSFLPEDQRLQWINGDPPIHNGLIELAIDAGQPRFRDAALAMIANAKALMVDAKLAERKLALCVAETATQAVLDTFILVSSEVANLTYMQMTRSLDSARVIRMKRLAARRDSLELQVNQLCLRSNGVVGYRYVTSHEILSRLAPGETLWDIIRCDPTDSAELVLTDCSQNNEHYIFFVCDAKGVRELHDAGPVAEIDSLVLALRTMMRSGAQLAYSPLASRHEQEIRRIATELSRRFPGLSPREDSSPGTLYISPDGLLGLLPFEILTLDSTRYVIDSYRISYLASSKDLTGFSASQQAIQRATIFANPAFDASITAADSIDASQSVATSGSNGRAATQCFGQGFNRLPGTGHEANSIAALLTRERAIPTKVYSGEQAAEGFFRSLPQPPTILHFATHGFFCSDGENGHAQKISSPMLRSGLALAGANRTLRGMQPYTSDDDGILTAYEISAMDLSATELVVLSACETGLGDITRSEGVIGLTRAFRQAGANSVIMNLWMTPDKGSCEVMTEFYRLWLSGTPKAEALRGAMLLAKEKIRTRYGHTHPYAWCGYVLVGNPY